MKDRPRKGRNVQFTPSDGIVAPRVPSTVTGLRFVTDARLGGTVLIDVADLHPRSLALGLAQALRRRSEVGGPLGTRAGVQASMSHMRLFFRYLSVAPSVPQTSGEVAVDHIDGFERWLDDTGRARTYIYSILTAIIALFREIAADDPQAVTPQLNDRLRYVSLRPVEYGRPRDAYSPFVARQLRDAARADIARLSTRVDGCLPPRLADHSEADIRDQARICHERLLDDGFISSTDGDFLRLRYALERRGEKASSLLSELHERHYIIRPDLPAILILFGLDTGMEIECVRRLRVDCLTDAANGTVGVAYVKSRSRGGEHKRMRVRDGGPTTPGGLIRLVLQASERSRRRQPSDVLIHYYDARKFHEGFRYAIETVRAWIKRHAIVDDDGRPLILQLSRLRKTHKALWYRKTEGHMARFAVGHSVKVAARHYADVPSLRPLHEATVIDALWDASRLVDGKDDTSHPDHRFPVMDAGEEYAPEDVEALRSPGHVDPAGPQDVWLAGCSNFYDGPFAKAGSPCTEPFWGCLDCPNAVISEEKLPALIGFLDFIVEQRKALGAGDWAAKFGHVHARLVRQILPSFAPAVVAAARDSLEATLPPTYLPPEAFQ